MSIRPCIATETQSFTEQRLRTAFSELEPASRGERLIEILDWAVGSGVGVFSPATNPAFGIEGKAGLRIMSLYGTGEVYALFEVRRYESAKMDRQTLMDELLRLKVLDSGIAIDQIRSGKTCLRRVDGLSDEEFKDLMKLFAELSGT